MKSRKQQGTIESDIKRLGITAYTTFVYSSKVGNFVTLVHFQNEEDMNLYKLLGEFKESEVRRFKF